MERKFLVSVLLLLICGGALLTWQGLSAENEKKEKPKRARQDVEGEQVPDAIAEFFTGKLGPDGTYPFGIRRKWHEHDLEVKASHKVGVLADPFSDVKELGPLTVGGRTRDLLFTDGMEKIWAGAASGGLWTSNDVATTWSPVDDHADNLSVTSIDASPFNDDIMYYGTGEPRGSYKSRLGADGDGVYKSIDGGANWFACGFPPVPEDFANIWEVKCSPVNINTVYVGSKEGLFRSLNGGLTWLLIEAGDVTDIELFDTGEVLIAVNGQGIRKSPSGNPGTFAPVTGPFPTSMGRIAIEKAPSSPSRVYAIIAETVSQGDSVAAFMESLNKGSNWRWRTLPPAELGVCQNDYNLMLGVRKNNPDHVVVGMQRGAVTYDGGLTWQLLDIGHNDFHSFADHPANNLYFYVGTDGGVYEYEWLPGLPPFPRNQGYAVTQQWAGDHLESGDRILGSTQDNKTHKIVPAGVVALTGPESCGAKVHDQDNDIAYYYDFSPNGKNLIKYTDFNEMFPSQFQVINTDPYMNDDGITNLLYFGVNESDGDQLYVPTNVNLWRSVDQGASWDSLFTSNTFGISRIGMTNESDPTLYFGGISVFYRLDNAASAGMDEAVNLSATKPSGTIGCIKVNPANEDVLYVSFQNMDLLNPRIYRVDDATSASPSWTPIHGNLPASLPVNWVECDPQDPDNVLFAGTDYGLYFSNDGGQTWNKEDRIPNVYVIQLSLRESDRSLFAYTHGRGAWRLKLREEIAMPALSTFPEVEDFEGSMTGWNNDYDDDINWELYSGGPGPSLAGASPSAAHSGSNYLILAGAQPLGGKDKVGKIWSPEYDISNLIDPELTFFYYMQSPNMGSLKLAISTDQGQTWNNNVWSRSGNQGAGWKQGTVDLSPYASTGSVVFRWRGKTGTGANVGDMGLDLVTVDGTPSPKFGGLSESTEPDVDFLVYPSLFTNYVKVLPPEGTQSYELRLINLNGRVIKKLSNLQGEVELKTENLASGPYWLQCTTGQVLSNTKLIKR